MRILILLVFVGFNLNVTSACHKIPIYEDDINCDCLTVHNRLKLDDDSQKVNITADCNNCEIFVTEGKSDASNSTIINFKNCTPIETSAIISQSHRRIFFETKIYRVKVGELLDSVTDDYLLDIGDLFPDEVPVYLENVKDKQQFDRIHKVAQVIQPNEFFNPFECNEAFDESINVTLLQCHDGSKHIVGVSMSNKSIKDIPRNLLESRLDLVGLDLSYNRLAKLPKGLFINSTLKYLWLSHNQISNLTRFGAS